MKLPTLSRPLLLALTIATTQAQSDIACPNALPTTDCETCLGVGCVHAAGECMSSCDFIADVACWDMQYHPDKTVTEVCAIKTQQETDAEICAAVGIQDDCGMCTATLKSDGVSTCEYYYNDGGPGYCGAGGCGMMGICGTDTCREAPAPGNNATVGVGPCGGFTDCNPCLNSKIECAWIADQCVPSCDMIMDAACYHPSTFPNMTGPEICAIAEEAEEEVVDAHPCNGFDLCEPCLNSRIECAWIANQCEPSCDMIMDAACYHPSTFPNMTGPEICTIAEQAEEQVFDEGSHPCNGFDLCEPCLNSRIECAWVGGHCERACEVVPNATTCYHPAEEGFVNKTGPEICAVAVQAGDAPPQPEEEVATEKGGPQSLESAATTSHLFAASIALSLASLAMM